MESTKREFCVSAKSLSFSVHPTYLLVKSNLQGLTLVTLNFIFIDFPTSHLNNITFFLSRKCLRL